MGLTGFPCIADYCQGRYKPFSLCKMASPSSHMSIKRRCVGRSPFRAVLEHESDIYAELLECLGQPRPPTDTLECSCKLLVCLSIVQDYRPAVETNEACFSGKLRRLCVTWKLRVWSIVLQYSLNGRREQLQWWQQIFYRRVPQNLTPENFPSLTPFPDFP